MSDEEIFFTHTIVGQPLSVELGRPLQLSRDRSSTASSPSPLAVKVADVGLSVGHIWREWCLIQGAYPYPGRPRRRPGALRRFLERHALLLSLAALVMMAVTAGFMALLMGWPSALRTLLSLPL